MCVDPLEPGVCVDPPMREVCEEQQDGEATAL